MEAANKGAFEGKSPSIRLNIQLPHEQIGTPDQGIFFLTQSDACKIRISLRGHAGWFWYLG